MSSEGKSNLDERNVYKVSLRGFFSDPNIEDNVKLLSYSNRMLQGCKTVIKHPVYEVRLNGRK